jgi:hypothetical protein
MLGTVAAIICAFSAGIISGYAVRDQMSKRRHQARLWSRYFRE